MIGPITDSCALFVGGLAGTLFSGFIPKRVKETLPLIFGVITLCMGSTLVNKASALPVVVMALIVGSVIGELVFAESFLAKCIRALLSLIHISAKDAQRFPHRSPAYAQQAAQLFLGRKPAIRSALRTGQFENSLFHFHIQGFPLLLSLIHI